MVAQKSNETYGDDEGKSEKPYYAQHGSHFENSRVLLSTFGVEGGGLKLLGHVNVLPPFQNYVDLVEESHLPRINRCESDSC